MKSPADFFFILIACCATYSIGFYIGIGTAYQSFHGALEVQAREVSAIRMAYALVKTDYERLKPALVAKTKIKKHSHNPEL